MNDAVSEFHIERVLEDDLSFSLLLDKHLLGDLKPQRNDTILLTDTLNTFTERELRHSYVLFAKKTKNKHN